MSNIKSNKKETPVSVKKPKREETKVENVSSTVS